MTVERCQKYPHRISGRITGSCGCRLLDGSIRRTHGDRRSPVYVVWMAIKQRCDNPNNKSFGRYGGRGIRLCDRWRDAKFKEDMGPRPSPMHSIDRIDNNGHYEPRKLPLGVAASANENKSNNTVAFHNGEWKLGRDGLNQPLCPGLSS